MKMTIKLIKEWCRKNCITLNYKNCRIIKLFGNKLKDEGYEEQYDENFKEFPKVDNYKYLGINLN